MKKNIVIVDTDPGVDDALAIMYLLKYGCEIKGITTIYGNSNINNTTNNALKILSILGKKVPVYKGLERPLKVEPIIGKSHGDCGFGGYDIELNNIEEKKGAIEFLIGLLEREDNVTIICLGPMTNIASLSNLRPDLIKNIGKLIILGGVLGEKGNISNYAEFNIYNDPDAFKVVLSFNIKKYVIPINICRKVFFTLADFDKLENNRLSKSIKKITKQYIDYYISNKEYGDFKGGVMYDLLATIFYTNPEIFSQSEKYIEVVTNGTNIGETIEINNIERNCNIITGVNVNKLKTLFFNTMNYE